jgi:hypothetical protein
MGGGTKTSVMAPRERRDAAMSRVDAGVGGEGWSESRGHRERDRGGQRQFS